MLEAGATCFGASGGNDAVCELDAIFTYSPTSFISDLQQRENTKWGVE